MRIQKSQKKPDFPYSQYSLNIWLCSFQSLFWQEKCVPCWKNGQQGKTSGKKIMNPKYWVHTIVPLENSGNFIGIFFKVCSVCAFLYTKYLLVILLLSYCLSSMIASKNPAFPGMTSTITILRISLNSLSGENGWHKSHMLYKCLLTFPSLSPL